jgi:AraC-like DNA-binding protein
MSLKHVPRPLAAIAYSSLAGAKGPLHTHDRAQFIYAASGSMKVNTDLGCWIIPPQRAVWMPAGYPHQPTMIGAVELRTLYIREDICPAPAPNVPRMLGVSAFLGELVLRLMEMPGEYDESGQDGQVVKTFLGEIDWTPLHPVSLPPLHDQRLQVVEATLTKNPGSTRTLEDWATRLDCSPRTLARLFLKETGLSFHTWRDQIRTFAALPMMADNRPLSEIADELGYETAWAFTAMFKRVTGQLPSRYFSSH